MSGPATTPVGLGAGHVYWWEVMGCDYDDDVCHTQYDNIHIAALVPSMLSIACSFYIIFSGIYYHRLLGNLGFGALLPIFISVCDFLFEVMHSSDHIHNLHTGWILEGWACIFVGSMKPFSINCQTAWAMGTAVYLFYTIIISEGRQPNFGPHMIYLHAPCWGIPFIIFLVGFGVDAYGVEGPWCGVQDPWLDLWMVDWFIFLNYFILAGIYGYLFWNLHQFVKKYQGDSNYTKSVRKMKKVVRTFGLYPIAYLVQWIFYALFKAHWLPATYEWILVVVTTANLGGFYNFCLYYPLLRNQVERSQLKAMQNMVGKAGDGGVGDSTQDSTQVTTTTHEMGSSKPVAGGSPAPHGTIQMQASEATQTIDDRETSPPSQP